jgi:twitching motility protein PilT
MHQLLKTLVENNGSDLHITTGSPPQIRVDGRMTPLKMPSLLPAETKQICYSILTDAQKRKFEEENELDLSFGVKGLSRFRGNIFTQRGALAGVFRVIPYKILTFDELNLPPVVRELSRKPRGLILVTGPTGSGKSTTLASIIDAINAERHDHIITIEDPIEYLHPHKKCVVNQREIGADTQSFKKALKYILRQDPDVVLLGELRDGDGRTARAVTAVLEGLISLHERWEVAEPGHGHAERAAEWRAMLDQGKSGSAAPSSAPKSS